MAAQEKKIHAREAFQQFVSDELAGDLHSLGDYQRSIALTRFFLCEVYNKLYGNISDEDIEIGLVDGPNDLGIDFISKDDGTVVIIQSKHRKQGAKEKPADISHFKDVVKRIANPALKGSERLVDRLRSIDLETDSLRLYFVTMGALDNQARDIADMEANYPPQYSDLPDRCEWEFFGEAQLTEELRNARAVGRAAQDTEIDLYAIGPTGQRGRKSVIEVESGEFRSLVLVLDAPQIINAYQACGRDAIFSQNIRNFIGSTAKNKDIINTAKTKPDRFFYFNNGVSCLCRKYDIKDEKISVTGLQVINGAQTVKALFRASARPGEVSPWINHPPMVLVRITEIASGYAGGGRLREEITRYNNTQNVIRAADFRSNDSVQLNLRDQFGKMTRFGKRIVYTPKRTDDRPKNSEIIGIEEFAKTVYSFLEDPTPFSGSTSFLFEDSESGGYCTVTVQ